VAEDAIDALMDKLQDYFYNIEINKKLPKFLLLRSMEDNSFVCRLKFMTHGVVRENEVRDDDGEEIPRPVPDRKRQGFIKTYRKPVAPV